MEENNKELEGLHGEELLQKLYGKKLESKKTILEYISIIDSLKKDKLTKEQIVESYNLIYKSIDDMVKVVKTNTILHLKNQLRSSLGKYVENKDPKEKNYFIDFFKEAYPPNNRKKDFTFVLMDINRITEEQIWNTLTYINGIIIKGRKLTVDEEKDTLAMIEKLVGAGHLKYINRLKSLERLLKALKIRIQAKGNFFEIKREV